MTSDAQNRLASETSPYLQQHADNPVDWYPWGDEAFALARERNVPVLLSVGYSACHWCHVMAHESFEDGDVAAVMNERYVNIKVDREERPDVDKIYQVAHQLLTQRPGGWPLTMFLAPETQRPFFGGTYFPKEARYGMPAFPDLLVRVAEYYGEHRDDIRKQGEELTRVLRQIDPQPPADEPVFEHAPIDKAREKMGEQFDQEFGGLGGAPKFPHPANIERLLRHWRGTAFASEPDVDALYMVSLTLKRMADGGIRDHLGGGFCRYSVDRYWQIPHFEKMLYDNGPLLALYAQAAQATGEQEFRDVAAETADWLLRRMRAPNGGFWSSLDADSEGEEGRYYVWTPDEVQAVIDKDVYPLFARYYGLDADANFEGRWHLTVHADPDKVAEDAGLQREALAAKLAGARSALLAARQQRVPPGLDDKQLTAWNALAVRGLAIAGRVLDRDDLVVAASDAVDFLKSELLVDGRLMASYKDGRARFPAYLDDHAFLLDALLELLQCRWRNADLAFAVQIAELLLTHFHDADDGGFWFTADDHETLMHRPKPAADEALPSGAGIAALALQRLGYLLGETRYLDAASSTLKNAWPALTQYPHAHVSLLNVLEETLEPPEIIIIRGPAGEIGGWQHAVAGLYAPRRLVFAIPENAEDLPGALAEREPRGGAAIAYRCSGHTCSLPIDSLGALTRTLSES